MIIYWFKKYILIDAAIAAGGDHLPDTDLVVGVAGKQGGSIGRPGQRGALWGLALAGNDLGLELVNQILVLKIPNLDGWTSSNAKPIFVGGEAQSVDDVVVVKSVQMLALGQIPEHGLKVLATRSTKGTIGRNGDGVQVASVANVVGLQLAVGQIPHLDHSVPAGTDDDWVVVGWRESHARDPVTVSVWLLDGILALSQRVPQLDRLVAGTTHDLTVVGREGDGQDVVGVALEATSGLAHVKVPKTKGLVPRAGQSIVTVLRENNVGDEVAVTAQTLHWVSVAGVIVVELPQDQGLVSGRRKDGVGKLPVGGDLSHPVGVTNQGSLENQLFGLTHSHFGGVCVGVEMKG